MPYRPGITGVWKQCMRRQQKKNNAWQNKTVHSRVKTTEPEFPKIDRLNFQSTLTDFNVSFILLRWTYLNTHKCFPIHCQISTLKTTHTFVLYKGKNGRFNAQVFTEVKKKIKSYFCSYQNCSLSKQLCWHSGRKEKIPTASN